MEKFLNTEGLSQNERFNKVILLGGVAAVLTGLFFGVIEYYLSPFNLFPLYAVIAYVVVYVMRYSGRGVQKRFSTLGVILTIVGILAMEFSGSLGLRFHLFFMPSIFFSVIVNFLRSFVWISFFNISRILIIIFAIKYAYDNSRVV